MVGTLVFAMQVSEWISKLCVRFMNSFLHTDHNVTFRCEAELGAASLLRRFEKEKTRCGGHCKAEVEPLSLYLFEYYSLDSLYRCLLRRRTSTRLLRDGQNPRTRNTFITGNLRVPFIKSFLHTDLNVAFRSCEVWQRTRCSVEEAIQAFLV